MIVLGESIEQMKALESKSVDHIITDPPYSEHVQTNIRTAQSMKDYHSGQSADATRRRHFDFDHITQDDMEAFAREAARVCKRWIMVFCNVEISQAWREAFEAESLDYIRTMIWVKKNCPPQFSGDRPASGYECIVLAHPKGKKTWNAGGKRGIYEHLIVIDRAKTGTTRLHPAQKPLGLMNELVADFTSSGETILDPYMGSGTTGVACALQSREFIGVEGKKHYFEAAKKRLEAIKQQPRLIETV